MPAASDTKYYAPGFEVMIDGTTLEADISANIMAVTVDQKLDAADQCTLRITNHALQWTDKELFDEGGEVRIKMGYHPSALQLIFSGEITRLSPVFPESGVPTLTVSAYSRYYRLTRSNKQRTFRSKRDSEIAEEIARGAGLSSEVEQTPVVHEHLFQKNQTDIQFLRERAKLNGFELLIEDKTLYFRAPKVAEEKIFVFEWGKSLKSFEPCLKMGGQVTKVIVKGWDPATKKEIIGSAQRGDETIPRGGGETGSARTQKAFGEAEKVIVDKTVQSIDEANRIAWAHLNHLAQTFITGQCSSLGLPEIRAGKTVLIDLGKSATRFNGIYYVTSVKHTIDESGYLTSFEVANPTAFQTKNQSGDKP